MREIARYHVLLPLCRRHCLNVMCPICKRIHDVFRVKRFLKMQVTPVPQRYHTTEISETRIWRKSICYTQLTRGQ